MSARSGRGARAAAALAAAFATACGGAAPDAPRNAVLIVVDTLRCDHVGAYGYARDTTPAIDALAADGVRFERAYATSGWTAPSVASLLTGSLPSHHGLTRPKTALSEAVPTLPEVLQRAGFATAGIVSNPILGRRNGFARGFDGFDQQQARGHHYVSSDGVARTAEAALGQLSAGPGRFFLFVHLFDPHYEYRQHARWDFAAPSQGRLHGGEEIHALRAMSASLDAAEIGFLRDLYDEEIRNTDAAVGRIVDALRALGRLDDTLVVVTADHGEEFLERGWLGHTRTLFDELVRVPLVVRSPGGFATRVVADPVSLTELPRAIAQWLDVALPDAFAPSSLAARAAGRSPSGVAPPLMETDFVPIGRRNEEKTAKLQALVDGRFKLIRDELAGRVSLFDLVADPAEQHDLAQSDPQRVRRLTAELERRLAQARSGAYRARPRALGEAEREALRALGYGD